jgi:hypothetical protein
MSTQQQKRPSKPKSPPTPSRSLEDCVADARRLYDAYSHGSFARAEIGSALGVSSTSGPFSARLFSLREFGVIEPDGSNYKVSGAFMKMNSTDRTKPAFKTAALRAIKRSETFRDVLESFPNKLPPTVNVASRLETQKKFNAERAKQAAKVLEDSLRFAGVLDANNNIMPVRETEDPPPANDPDDERDPDENGDAGSATTLRVEIPVAEDRKVLVRYPRDLTSDEAKKVGAVLAAIVS